jgi:high-affinity K+ transport system ATPase subunit B
MPNVTFIPFTTQTRMSGVDLQGELPAGAAAAIRVYVGGRMPDSVEKMLNRLRSQGGGLVVASQDQVPGTVHRRIA